MQTIFTIGHSTRPINEFIDLLSEHSITQLVDIRTVPKSRYNPQFGQGVIEESLKSADIEYLHLKKLGGLRHATKSPINNAWRNKSFRNYADYMQTDDFDEGIKELIELSKSKVTAIMCAEAVPWRCHRSLVSDALIVRNISVCEIIAEGNEREHELKPFAVVDGTNITYPKSALPEEEQVDEKPAG
jgi:uncharacterized protein (DUF488 family)